MALFRRTKPPSKSTALEFFKDMEVAMVMSHVGLLLNEVEAGFARLDRKLRSVQKERDD